MASEIEVKLSIDPNQISNIQNLPDIIQWGRSLPEAKHLLNQYFDSPNEELKQKKMALRIRRDGDSKIMCLKYASKAFSQNEHLAIRDEYEWPILTNSLDSALLQKTDSMFTEKFCQSLQVVAETEFDRKTWMIEYDSGVVLELVADLGELRSSLKTKSFCEIEVELKKGVKGDLLPISTQIQQHLAGKPESRGKSTRARMLS